VSTKNPPPSRADSSPETRSVGNRTQIIFFRTVILRARGFLARNEAGDEPRILDGASNPLASLLFRRKARFVRDMQPAPPENDDAERPIDNFPAVVAPWWKAHESQAPNYSRNART
jgi:hypothetical protein